MTIYQHNVAQKQTITNNYQNDDIIIPSQNPTIFLSSTQLFLRVAYLGLAFSLIFSGYHVAQSFVTSIYSSSGFVVLGIIYLTFAITSLFAPLFNTLLEGKTGHGTGEKLTIVISGFGYVVFIVTVATGMKEALFIGGFVKGISSGLLWISQGMWLTKLVTAYSKQHDKDEDAGNIVGIATGVFFTLFNLNSIIGNLVVISLFQAGATVQTTILVMAGIVAFGSILVIFSPKLPNEPLSKVPDPGVIEMVQVQDILQSKDSVNTVDKRLQTHSIAGRLVAIYRLAVRPKTFYLTPYLICQGVNLAYTFGNYPTFIEYVTEGSSSSSEGLNTESALNIAYCFLAYGFGSMLGSYGWGKLYDYCRCRLYPLLVSHVILVICAFTLLLSTIVTDVPYPLSLFPCLVMVGFLFGLIDFLTNAIINNSITRNYDADSVPLAFSWYRFCYCLGFGLASIIGALIPGIKSPGFGWVSMIVINIMFMLLSVVSGFFLEAQKYKIYSK